MIKKLPIHIITFHLEHLIEKKKPLNYDRTQCKYRSVNVNVNNKQIMIMHYRTRKVYYDKLLTESNKANNTDK